MNKQANKRIDFAARSVARQLAVQALYQWQLNESSLDVLQTQFSEDKDYKKADQKYFKYLLENIFDSRLDLDNQLEELLDRPLIQLDPVAHAVLWLGLHEITQQLDIPYRVIINESVKLAKKFGPTDSHKYINAILDKISAKHRAPEIKQYQKSKTA